MPSEFIDLGKLLSFFSIQWIWIFIVNCVSFLGGGGVLMVNGELQL